MKMSRKNKLQVVEVDNSYYIEWNSFMEIYKTCSKEPYTVLVNDTTLSSSNHLLSSNHSYILRNITTQI